MTDHDVTEEQVRAYNEQAERLPNPLGHPCLTPHIVHKDEIQANDYNPNHVPDPELNLLEKSIQTDGLTMTIVVYQKDDGGYVIVDGFHRFLVLTENMGEEWIPVSRIDKSISERMAATVRHNRARGDHTTELMGQLVSALEDEGMDAAAIADELEMEPEEIVRLKQVTGAADELAGGEYTQSWGVQDGERE